MKNLLRNFFFLGAALASPLCFTSCDPVLGEESGAELYDLDGFIKQYNIEIENWLKSKVEETEKRAGELKKKLSEYKQKEETGEALSEQDGKKKRALERAIVANQRDMEKYQFRQSLGGYFTFKTLDDIPSDLVWETGMDEPEIGDPRAKKGGTFNYFINEFPATLRPFGPKSNHNFRGKLYDEIDVGLLEIHPHTQKPIPGVAYTWAVSKDRRTVYYKINPKATYSDGEPVRARDIMTYVYVQISPNVNNPYAKQYFKEQFANITVYDEMTVSVTIPEPKPDVYMSTALQPYSPKFYKEYGPDYKTRYQWRIPPTTGAYTLPKEDIQKGRSVTVRRVKDWWAKDMKYYRYRFNVDSIRYLVIRDISKCFELFKIGEIDMFWISKPEFWYEKTEIEPVYKGYIEKKKFYKQWPLIPWGIYLNVDEGILKNKDVRLGIQYAMNFQKVNDQLYRGDYVRINQFSDGFGEFTDTSIKARVFNPKIAREYFTKAGFTKEGDDGILVNGDGKRLSVSCTTKKDPAREKILEVLKDEAKSCGLELKIDALEGSVAFAKTSEKRHEACYGGWGVQPPTPVYYQFFHSKAAFDASGNRNSSSNNQNVFANERMDVLAEQVRNARSYPELKKAAFEAQQIVHDEAIFIPGLDKDFTAIGHWKWVKWPNSETTKFSYPVMYEPIETNLFWIDEEVKKETLKARRAGKTFPEIEEVIDIYRKKN